MTCTTSYNSSVMASDMPLSTWHLNIDPLFSLVTSSCTCWMTLGRQSEPSFTICSGRFSMTSNLELPGVEISHVSLTGGRPAKTSHSNSHVLFSSTMMTSLFITGFSGLAAIKNYLVKILTICVFFFNTKFYSLGHTVLALFNLECLIPLRIIWGLHIKCVEYLSKIKVFCICSFKVAFSFFPLEYH